MCEECFWKINSASLRSQFVFSSSSHLCVFYCFYLRHINGYTASIMIKKSFLDLVGSSDDHLTAEFSQNDSDSILGFISSQVIFFTPSV